MGVEFLPCDGECGESICDAGDCESCDCGKRFCSKECGKVIEDDDGNHTCSFCRLETATDIADMAQDVEDCLYYQEVGVDYRRHPFHLKDALPSPGEEADEEIPF